MVTVAEHGDGAGPQEREGEELDLRIQGAVSALKREFEEAREVFASASQSFGSKLAHFVEASTVGRPRILVLENDAFARRALRDLIPRLVEADVDAVASPDIAMEFARSREYSHLIVDLNLDEGRATGMEFALEVRHGSLRPMVPIIAISGEENDRIRTAATVMGANAFMAKPFDATELRAKILALCDYCRPARPERGH